MPRKFGWGSKPDARDRVLRLTATDREWRVWPAWRLYLDQQATPECVGYSAAHLLDCAPHRQYLDPSGIYELAKHYDEWQGESYDGTSCRAAMKVLKLLGFFREYRRARSAETVARHVLELGPVQVGTDWYSGMTHTDERFVMHPTGELLGGHAYLIRGYNRRTRLFRCKGSYGRDFGDQGDTYLRHQDLDRLLRAGGEAWVGVKQNLERF